MSDDDTYEIPLQDQRVFGAGIKRKRVKFVPSASKAPPVATPTTPSQSVSDIYLKIVLGEFKGDADKQRASQTISGVSADSSADQGEAVDASQVCDICSLPLLSAPPPSVSGECLETGDAPDGRRPANPRPHEASLAHQVCLAHSHPPSHLDRNRKGLAYLSSYGWDPDARLGLGASGQGIQFPIKSKPKDDKLGIGVVLPKKGEIKKKEKLERLDAGKVRKLYEKDKRKTEKLRAMFYQNEDVDRYLGKK